MTQQKSVRLQVGVGLLTSLAVGGALNGCSGSSSAPNPGSPISGTAMFGPVKQATITAYPLKLSGLADLTSPVASGTTDAKGNYSINIPTSFSSGQPLVVQVSSGSYTEEASGENVPLGGNAYSAVLPYFTPGVGQIVTISPFTEIAYRILKSRLQTTAATSTGALTYASLLANYQVSSGFGIYDIIGTTPDNPSGTISSGQSGIYTIALLGISQAAKGLSTDSIAVAGAYAQSFISSSGSFPTVAGSSYSAPDASGISVNVAVFTFGLLGSTFSQIASGIITLNGVTPPASYTAPTLTATPATSVPAGYSAGGGNIVCVTTQAPAPVFGSGQTQAPPTTTCGPAGSQTITTGTVTSSGSSTSSTTTTH